MRKIKWNWGTKLFIAIVIFMSFIFVLVYKSINNEILLVEKDYYPKGLKYQDRLDEIENARPIAEQLKVYQESDYLVLVFPEIYPDSGTVYFFRPSNTDLDVTFKLSPEPDFTMSFPKSYFQKGKYLLKISWVEKDTSFYIEKPYYFN
jgi:hypothetical protein